MEDVDILPKVIELYSKFLSLFKDQSDSFISDVTENLSDLSNADSLIYEETAALNNAGFNKIHTWLLKQGLEVAEILMINLIGCAVKAPFSGLFNLGGLTFKSGRAYKGDSIDIYAIAEIISVKYHSVLVIDNYVYDFIMGLNGISVPKYIEFLYSMNSTLGVDIAHSQYCSLPSSESYLSDLQYASLCGVIGPDYEQYKEMESLRGEAE